MLKKDEKQIEELKGAKASRKLAQEFIEKYEEELETSKVLPQKDHKEETIVEKKEERKGTVFCVN